MGAGDRAPRQMYSAWVHKITPVISMKIFCAMRSAAAVVAASVIAAMTFYAAPVEAQDYRARRERENERHRFQTQHWAWDKNTTYIEQAQPPQAPYPAAQPQAGAAAGHPGQPAAGMWYYCDSAGAYYPHVPTCNDPWPRSRSAAAALD